LIMGDGAVAYMSLSTTDNATALKIRNYSGNSDIATFERTTGNVGIGTSSPNQVLHVESSSVGVTRATIINTGNAAAGAGVQFITKNGATQVSNATLRTDNAGNFSIFTGTTGETERMRIESGGNLLVGKTTTDIGTVGFRVDGANGFATITRDGYEPLILNRKTSDGDIAKFQKDGTTVGSIGSAYGVVSYINLDPRSGGTGVGATNTDSVIPVTGTGVGANGTKDLGISSARWRDLYLSGVGYVGTTQEANTTLSGTTPSIDADTAGSFTLTTSGNTTFTFASVTSGRSVGFVLKLTAGGGHTITWPSSVDWAGGTAPDAPASGETDVLVFYTVDGGTNWYGVLSIDAAA